MLDSLLELNLIAPQGRRESPGRPTLWGNRYKIGTWSNTLGREVQTIEEAVQAALATVDHLPARLAQAVPDRVGRREIPRLAQPRPFCEEPLRLLALDATRPSWP